jgi:hypothetical protein
MSTDLLMYLSKEIQEEMRVIEQDTVLGKANTVEDYKFACGIYRGLLMANNILIQTSERMEKADE